MKTQSRELTEGLTWMQDQLGPRVGEEVLAGQLFRPRGAWGDEPRRWRRFLWRNFGVAQGPLHAVERKLTLMSFAAVTPSRLVLVAGRSSFAPMLPGDPVAEWPREAVSVGWQRRTAVSESFHALPHGLGVTTHHATKIVVARIAVVGEQPLELDFPAGAVTSHLRKVLDG